MSPPVRKMTTVVDLRSDTITRYGSQAVIILVRLLYLISCCRPSPGMREAMATAVVGDDVFRDDPTVLRLGTVLSSAFTNHTPQHTINQRPQTTPIKTMAQDDDL